MGAGSLIVDDLLWVIVSAVGTAAITVASAYAVGRVSERVAQRRSPLWTQGTVSDLIRVVRTRAFWASPTGALCFWEALLLWPILLLGLPLAGAGTQEWVVVSLALAGATLGPLLSARAWDRESGVFAMDPFTAYDTVTRDTFLQILVALTGLIVVAASFIFLMKRWTLLAGLSATHRATVATEVNRFSLLLSLHVLSLLVLPLTSSRP